MAATAPTTVPATLPAPTTRPPADFDIVVPDPGVGLSAGATAVFLVIVAPRTSVSPMVTFLLLGLPDGAQATMSPNPTAGATELRITTPTNLIPATYTMRLVGTAGSVSHSSTIAMAVSTAVTTTTTSPASTTPVPAGAFALGVVGDGKRLRSGGAVSFSVTIVSRSQLPRPREPQRVGRSCARVGGVHGDPDELEVGAVAQHDPEPDPRDLHAHAHGNVGSGHAVGPAGAHDRISAHSSSMGGGSGPREQGLVKDW